MDEKIVLDFDSWNIKPITRKRNRMKLQIKLSKEEAQAFNNFQKLVKPPEIAEDDFLKGIFKIGVETMEMKLMEAVQEAAAQEAAQAEKQEVEVPVVGEGSEVKPQTESTDEV